MGELVHTQASLPSLPPIIDLYNHPFLLLILLLDHLAREGANSLFMWRGAALKRKDASRKQSGSWEAAPPGFKLVHSFWGVSSHCSKT